MFSNINPVGISEYQNISFDYKECKLTQKI